MFDSTKQGQRVILKSQCFAPCLGGNKTGELTGEYSLADGTKEKIYVCRTDDPWKASKHGGPNETVGAPLTSFEFTDEPPKHEWEITLSDGFSPYKYIIEGRGDVSIHDIKEHLEKFLGGKAELVRE